MRHVPIRQSGRLRRRRRPRADDADAQGADRCPDWRLCRFSAGAKVGHRLGHAQNPGQLGFEPGDIRAGAALHMVFRKAREVAGLGLQGLSPRLGAITMTSRLAQRSLSSRASSWTAGGSLRVARSASARPATRRCACIGCRWTPAGSQFPAPALSDQLTSRSWIANAAACDFNIAALNIASPMRLSRTLKQFMVERRPELCRLHAYRTGRCADIG